MKVIRHSGWGQPWTHQLPCSRCASVLEACDGDLEYEPPYGGNVRDEGPERFMVRCPVCGSRFAVSGLPEHVKCVVRARRR